MALLKLINIQGWIGLAVSVFMLFLLIGQKAEIRHWKKQSAQFEKLYKGEAYAHAQTVNNYYDAADKARAADAANKARVKAEQEKIDADRVADFNKRIADARLRAGRQAEANSSGAGSAAVPRVPDASGGADQAGAEDGFSTSDRLIATEQAIQLDELIKWVKAQAGVDVGNDR